MRKLRLLFATLVLLVTGVVATNAEVVYVEVDLTSQFNSLATTQWTGSSGQVGWAAPKVNTNSGLNVAAWERYDGNCTNTGTVMKSTVTGLTSGTYKIELYGAAAFTFGRGFGSDAFTGGSSDTSTSFNENDQITENTGVTLYAKTSEGTYGGEIPISYATNFNSTGIATVVIEGVEVGASGEIEIGMTKTSTSTNWHVIQLKGVTALVEAVPVYNQALSDAEAALTHKMSASAQNNLSSAISTYGGLGETGTAEQYTAAIEALTNATSAAQNSIDAYAIFNSVIDVFADAKQALDENGQAAYDDGGVLAGLQESYNAGTLQEITSEQKAAIANALAVASKAQTSDNSPMTWAIVNHSFETGSLEAWTAENTAGDTGVKPNSNNTYQTSGCDGDFLFNTWSGDAVGYGISQTITGMPAGSYKLTASFAGPANATVELFANSESTTVTQTAPGTFTDVDLEFDLASAGDITIGTQNSTSWYKVDNFQLTLVKYAINDIASSVELPEGVESDLKYFPSFYQGTELNEGKLQAIPGAEVKFSVANEEGLVATPKVVKLTDTGGEGDEITLSQGLTKSQWSFTMPNQAVKVKAIYVAAAQYTITGLPADNTTTTVDGVEQSGEIKALASKKVVVTPDQRYEITEFKATYLGGDGPTLVETELTITDETGGAKSFIVPEANVTVTCTATLIVKELTDDMIEFTNGKDYEFTGEPQEPAIVVYDPEYDYTLVEGQDYTVEYSDNTESGEATVTITAMGEWYSGEASAKFYIGRKDLNEEDITIGYIYQEDYDGQKHTPQLTVRDGTRQLIEDVDYKVAFKDNVEAGSCRVTIDGIGDYKGRVRKYFNIKSFVLDIDMVQDIADQTWTGKAVTPAISVINGNMTLTEGKDFTVKFKNNVNEGTATAIINGTGNFRSVDLVKTFKIVKKAEVAEPEAVDSPGEATAIDGVKAAKAGKTAYDLQGRKVVGNRKAVVIIDGKLVLKK